jgi:16S rRNA C967 or C1407 C5-methylase (RsmB/RsmF family)/NOL1/NOP2/fmu family ribosome biogenesis protein
MKRLPELFVSNTENMLGADEAQKLFAALDTPPPVSIRYNPYKLGEPPVGERVAWSRYGYYLPERPVFTLDPLFHAGVYYVQEAASMFLEHIYSSLFEEDDSLKILDLCAAPGGKTTLLSTLAGLESVVVSNEVIRQRASLLADNVSKWGLGNVAVTSNDAVRFGEFSDYFDLILVDAPCSGEGMFRKDAKAIEEWSADNVKLCAQRQRRLLSNIWGSLRPGGILIYSTCTFNRLENEENVAWLASEFDIEGIDIPTDAAWGIVQGAVECGDGKEPIHTFRFYPHRVRSEGLFCAVVRKPDGKERTKTPRPQRSLLATLPKADAAEAARWVVQPEFMRFASIGSDVFGYYDKAYHTVKALSESLSVIHSGVRMGQLFHGKLKPDHSLAMFQGLRTDSAPTADLNLDNALNYLRKADIDAGLLTEGINLIRYEGFPLGWAKRVGSRVNNLYPKELRIMNL